MNPNKEQNYNLSDGPVYQHIDVLGEKKEKSTALNYNIKWNSIIVWELNDRSFTVYTANNWIVAAYVYSNWQDDQHP